MQSSKWPMYEMQNVNTGQYVLRRLGGKRRTPDALLILCTIIMHQFCATGHKKVAVDLPFGKSHKSKLEGQYRQVHLQCFSGKYSRILNEITFLDPHIKYVYILFCWELYPSSLFTSRATLCYKNENEPRHTKDQQKSFTAGSRRYVWCKKQKRPYLAVHGAADSTTAPRLWLSIACW